MTDQLHVLTGPPGSGKTTLVEALAGDLAHVTEPARAVIAGQRAIGGRGTSDQDEALFVELMLTLAIADHERMTLMRRPALFDRGIPDCLAYAAYHNLPDAHIRRAAEIYRYEGRVFWMPAWDDIYETDDERTMSFDEADAFGDLIRHAYDSCGYELIDVPEDDVDERAEFVREYL